MNPRNWLSGFASLLFSKKQLYAIINSIIAFLGKEGNDYYAIFGSNYKLERQLFPIEWFGDGKRVPFEGNTFMCPIESKMALELTFGGDYMHLPPVEQRVTHKPRRVITSKGEKFIFYT